MRESTRLSLIVSIRRPPTGPSAASSSLGELVLRLLGVEQSVVEEVLGDFAEEYALRSASDGSFSAWWWCSREALRSAPHLGASALQHALRNHPSRLAALLALFGLIYSLLLGVRLTADGAPTFLTTGRDGDLIVNSTLPVKIPMRVLDETGRVLSDSGVRYHWTSGAPVSVLPNGVVTCAQPGDATVRASLGALETRVLLRCRPVHDVRAADMLDLVVGDRSRAIPFEATDASGHPVTLLSGQVTVGDSTIATLDGQSIRARTPGSTWVKVRLGDRESFTSVHAYQRVARIEGIRPDQRLAVSVRLEPREIRRWTIPPGHYFLAILPSEDEKVRPWLAVDGARCDVAVGHFVCWAREPATVIAYYPRSADQAQSATGSLTIWRQEDP